jgi:hypothetical protein
MASLTLREGDLILDGVPGENCFTFPDGSRLYSASARVLLHTASSTGVVTIDWNKCEIAKVTLNQPTSFVFLNGADMQSYMLEIKQPAGQAYDVYLPATVRYGQDFTMYRAPSTSKRDKLLFMRSVSEGTYDFITASKGF